VLVKDGGTAIFLADQGELGKPHAFLQRRYNLSREVQPSQPADGEVKAFVSFKKPFGIVAALRESLFVQNLFECGDLGLVARLCKYWHSDLLECIKEKEQFAICFFRRREDSATAAFQANHETFGSKACESLAHGCSRNSKCVRHLCFG
jgi:hypothetical protein